MLTIRRVRPLALLVFTLASPLAFAAGDRGKTSPDEGFVLAAPKSFAAAVEAVARATGATPGQLQLGEVPLDQGRSFLVPARTAERLLAGSHATFRKAGFYLFRYERSYGIGGDKDHVGLLNTADRGAVIRRVGTSSKSHELTPEKLVAWLDALAKDEPFELAEVGEDFVAGTFVRAPKDPLAVAKRCAQLAPDLLGGRQTSIELLAAEIRDNRTLYLIW